MITLPLISATAGPTPSCENCGACCMHMITPPFVTISPALIAVGALPNRPADPARGHPDWGHLAAAPPEAKRKVADLHHMILCGLDTRGVLEMPCAWFDPRSKGCRYHAHRPELCRDFPTGGASCHEHRIYRGVGDLTPNTD